MVTRRIAERSGRRDRVLLRQGRELLHAGKRTATNRKEDHQLVHHPKESIECRDMTPTALKASLRRDRVAGEVRGARSVEGVASFSRTSSRKKTCGARKSSVITTTTSQRREEDTKRWVTEIFVRSSEGKLRGKKKKKRIGTTPAKKDLHLPQEKEPKRRGLRARRSCERN